MILQHNLCQTDILNNCDDSALHYLHNTLLEIILAIWWCNTFQILMYFRSEWFCWIIVITNISIKLHNFKILFKLHLFRFPDHQSSSNFSLHCLVIHFVNLSIVACYFLLVVLLSWETWINTNKIWQHLYNESYRWVLTKWK